MADKMRVACHFCGRDVDVDEAAVVKVRADHEWVCDSCEAKWDEYREESWVGARLTAYRFREEAQRLYEEEK